MTSRTLSSTILCATALATACSFDLTEVDSAREAQLVLSLELAQCDAPPVLYAAFHPGSGSDGSPRAAGDDTLRIGTAHIAPDDVRADGWRVYPRHEVALDSGSSARLHFLPPRADGSAGPPPSLEVEILRPAAPDTIAVTREGDVEVIVLGMEGDGGGVYGEEVDEVTRQVVWQIEVRGHESGRYLFLSGADFPAGGLLFPAHLLPGSFESGRLVLRGSMVQILSSAGGEYEVRVERTFNCSVVLTVADSVPIGRPGS